MTYQFNLEETRELCYAQALSLLKQLPLSFSSPLSLQTIKQLALFLNFLTDEQFVKLHLETQPKPPLPNFRKPQPKESKEKIEDDLFG